MTWVYLREYLSIDFMVIVIHTHTYVSYIYRCINSRIPYLHMESLSSEGKGTKFIFILGLEGKIVSTRLFLITVCLSVCVCPHFNRKTRVNKNLTESFDSLG